MDLEEKLQQSSKILIREIQYKKFLIIKFLPTKTKTKDLEKGQKLVI